jgi:hypothetical protein
MKYLGLAEIIAIANVSTQKPVIDGIESAAEGSSRKLGIRAPFSARYGYRADRTQQERIASSCLTESKI